MRVFAQNIIQAYQINSQRRGSSFSPSARLAAQEENPRAADVSTELDGLPADCENTVRPQTLNAEQNEHEQNLQSGDNKPRELNTENDNIMNSSSEQYHELVDMNTTDVNALHVTTHIHIFQDSRNLICKQRNG